MTDKTILDQLPTEWRSTLWASMPRTYTTGPRKDTTHHLAIAVAISILTGLRPAELAAGVRLRSDAGQRTVSVHITGAKHDKVSTPAGQGIADRGHEWRVITVDNTSPWAAFLYTALQRQRDDLRSQWVLFRYNASTYRNSLVTYGLRLFGVSGLCPYAFRHALGTDLKTSDAVTIKEAADALGHVSTATLWRYGDGRKGRHGNRPFLSVHVPGKPVAPTLGIKAA